MQGLEKTDGRKEELDDCDTSNVVPGDFYIFIAQTRKFQQQEEVKRRARTARGNSWHESKIPNKGDDEE